MNPLLKDERVMEQALAPRPGNNLRENDAEDDLEAVDEQEIDLRLGGGIVADALNDLEPFQTPAGGAATFSIDEITRGVEMRIVPDGKGFRDLLARGVVDPDGRIVPLGGGLLEDGAWIKLCRQLGWDQDDVEAYLWRTFRSLGGKATVNREGRVSLRGGGAGINSVGLARHLQRRHNFAEPANLRGLANEVRAWLKRGHRTHVSGVYLSHEDRQQERAAEMMEVNSALIFAMNEARHRRDRDGNPAPDLEAIYKTADIAIKANERLSAIFGSDAPKSYAVKADISSKSEVSITVDASREALIQAASERAAALDHDDDELRALLPARPGWQDDVVDAEVVEQPVRGRSR